METVEGTVRQAHDLGKAAKERVKTDFDTAYERSKTILENWETMKIMDVMWTAKAEQPDRPVSAPLRPYLMAAVCIFFSCFFYLYYFVDVSLSQESSLSMWLLIRFGEIAFVFFAFLSLLCCFEQGLNLVLGSMFMIHLFWNAPPRKRA